MSKVKYQGNVKHTYLLRRRITCNTCGAGYWGRAIRNHNTKKSTSKTVWYYYEHNPNHKCTNPSKRIPQHKIEDAVKTELLGWMVDPAAKWDEYIGEKKQASADVEKQIKKKINERKKLALEFERAKELVVKDVLTEAEFKEQRERIVAEDDKLKLEEKELREILEPEYHVLLGSGEAMEHELSEAFKSGDLGVNFYSADDWFECIDLFDTSVRVIHKKVEIKSVIGKKSLPLKDLQS